MAEEAGLSLSFQALGLEQIQAKIATTSRSFKSLERHGRQLGGLGRGLGRLASLGGGGKGGGGGGAAGGLIREMASFAIMTRLATRGFRIFDSIGAERLVTRRAAMAVAAKGRRVVRRIGSVAGRVASRVAGAFPEVKMLAKEIATGYRKLFSSATLIRLIGRGPAAKVAGRVAGAIPKAKMIGKELLSGYRKLFSSATLIRLIGRGPAAKVAGAISSVGKSVGGVASRVASGIGRGVAAGVVLGSRAVGVVTSGMRVAFAKLGAAVTGIATVIGTTGAAIAISAGAILAVIGGAYFKIDKKIASAMKWLNQNVFTPIGKNLSMVGEFWKNALGRLAERGDLLSKAYTDRQAKVRFTPQERQFYEQQVKFDLETDDMEEGIQTQIDELRAIWKEQDRKFSEGLNRIVEDMLHKDRI